MEHKEEQEYARKELKINNVDLLSSAFTTPRFYRCALKTLELFLTVFSIKVFFCFNEFSSDYLKRFFLAINVNLFDWL